jgi:predicted ArsR family transcriptional regulator
MEGTRLRILQILQRNTNDTVEGLAKGVGLASATIRRHLDILQRDHLVAFSEVRKKTGRPEYSFYLTEEGQEALPKDYSKLLGMVVQQMSELSTSDTQGKDGAGVLDLVFSRLADDAVRPLRADLAGKGLKERLATLENHLEEQSFLPEVDVSDGSLNIRLMNCPFRAVALQNKAVCSFDLNVVTSLLDMKVKRSGCICDGDSGCTYTADLSDEAAKELATA